MSQADEHTEYVDSGIDMRAAQGMVEDLMPRRRWLYWVDFLGGMAVLGLMFYVGGWSLSWWSLVLLLPISVLSFRLGAFIHEIQHFRKGELQFFRLIWNVTFGCVMGTPDPIFEYHRRHHAIGTFGTAGDAEYADLPRPFPRIGYLELIKGALLAPLLLNLRFSVGTASLVFSRSLREKFERRLSEFHLDYWRVEEPWTKEQRRYWLPFELVALAERIAFLVLLILGIVPIFFAVYLYLGFAGAMLVNRLRFLLEHDYVVGPPRSLEAQVVDSFDYPTPWSCFWAPMGLGYHATHHWFPRMPYHALGRAHRRLAASEEYGDFVATFTGPKSYFKALANLSKPQEGGAAPVNPE